MLHLNRKGNSYLAKILLDILKMRDSAKIAANTTQIGIILIIILKMLSVSKLK